MYIAELAVLAPGPDRFAEAPDDPVSEGLVRIYAKGRLRERDLPAAAARLEAKVRADAPGALALRARRCPFADCVGLAVLEPRVAMEGGRHVVMLESHVAVLSTAGAFVIHGTLPGGADRHLFQRVVERRGASTAVANVKMGMARLWPAILLARARDGLARRRDRDALARRAAFGVDRCAGRSPALGSDGPGHPCAYLHGLAAARLVRRRDRRVWVETRTFVASNQLQPEQIELRDRLNRFLRDHADVVSELTWRWRVGLGQPDEAVDAVAQVFGLKMIDEDRTGAAMAAMATLLSSDLWMSEARINAENQRRARLWAA